MQYVNLHNHTIYSDGQNTMEENVRSAMQRNMLALGFSDHSFTQMDSSYCMHLQHYESYLEEVKALKEKYAGQIDLYAGIELDADSDPNLPEFDYTIGSVHYLLINGEVHPLDHSRKQQEKCCEEVFGGDVLAFAQAYYDKVVAHIQKCKPTFVGHFDVITKFSYIPEEDPRYQEIATKALEEVAKVCPYIEVNTGAISRKWRDTPYPARFLLEKMLALGAKPVLGSDSHQVAHLTYWFDEAVALLKEVGFTHIAQFGGKGFIDIAI